MKFNKTLSDARKDLSDFEQVLCIKYGVSCWTNLVEKEMDKMDVLTWHNKCDLVTELTRDIE
jgi:hypothetical protein